MKENFVSTLMDFAPSSDSLSMGRGSEEGTEVSSVTSGKLAEDTAGEGDGASAVRSGTEREGLLLREGLMFTTDFGVLSGV